MYIVHNSRVLSKDWMLLPFQPSILSLFCKMAFDSFTFWGQGRELTYPAVLSSTPNFVLKYPSLIFGYQIPIRTPTYGVGGSNLGQRPAGKARTLPSVILL